jgi:hypothetical protein
MTINKLEKSMSMSEYKQWQEYYKHEPFLSDRLEVLIANLTSIFANTKRQKNSDKVYEASDFTLSTQYKKDEIKLSLKEQVIKAMSQFKKVIKASSTKTQKKESM